MDLFSDFEEFLFKNNFSVNNSEPCYRDLLNNPLFDNTGSLRELASNPTHLNDTELFIIENEFREEDGSVDHQHLLTHPLHHPIQYGGRRATLNDFESYLFRNNFTENVDNVDYVHLAANPLFFEKKIRLISRLVCKLCSAECTSLLTYLQHMSGCRRKLHRRTRPKPTKLVFRCPLCLFKTTKISKLELHTAVNHRCHLCPYSGASLAKHQKTHQRGGQLSKRLRLNNVLTEENPFKEIKAFKGYVRTYRESGARGQNSLLNYLLNTKKYVRELLMQSLKDLKLCKAQLSVYVTFKRFLCRADNGRKIYETINKPMNSRMSALLNEFSIEDVYAGWCTKIRNNVSIFEQYGSGWVFSKVTGADLRVGKLLPQRGGCYFKLPPKLENKKAIINVASREKECFKWALLAGLHQSDLTLTEKNNPNRSYYYKRFENLYDFNSVEFPVETCKIPSFENSNGLAINVFSYDWEDGVLPVYISPHNYKGMRTVDLLLLTNSNTDRQHYVTITDIHKLLGKRNHHRRLLCYYCLNTFPLCRTKCNDLCTKNCKLNDHVENCRKFKYQKIKMPSVDQDGILPHIFFKNLKNQLRTDYVVYADLESLLIEESGSTHDRDSPSYTEKLQSHVPCGFAYVVVDVDGNFADGRVYRGPKPIEIFLKDLKEISDSVFRIYEEEAKMLITSAQQVEFDLAVNCHICEQELDDDKVRDHDHRTGLYRGAAHSSCNLFYFQQNRLPVVMHNFRGYDSHFVIQGFHNFGERVSVIPTNSERFMTVSVDGIVFIDSLQFLNSKLDTLVENLARDGDAQKFKLLHQLFQDTASVNLLKKKGVYPYDYFNNWSVFQETTLPGRDAFYNKLRKEVIEDKDYAHARSVFEHFECRHLGDYHDVYLLTDVLLLACVFESFRSMSLKTYKLDPVHYISAPGLAWDAALRMTKVRLEQLTDINMYEFFESGLRGGVSMITKRKSEAYNKYMSIYTGDDASPDQKYIISWDMNNLYGIAMMQKLPVSNFRFLCKEEIERLNPMDISDDAEDGFIFECDLDYRKEYHTTHNDYPLAPERTNVEYEVLSDYQQRLVDSLEIKYHDDQVKLIPHLNAREKYKVHCRNLKYYLDNGMILTKVHRVLTFRQDAWLAPYIDFNTQMRTRAKNKFETDFFKLMNNAVYGKGMENVRKRMSIRLVNKWDQAKRLIRKPQYMSHDVLHKNLCSFKMENGTVNLDKAVYTGFTVLDLSKLYIYRFHYDYVKTRYGANAQLLYTDTDSLAYEIRTNDVYRDMDEDIHLFDTSEYPKDHFLYSSVNKKVLGKMHDEANGEVVFKFVGLAPKVYCMVIGEFVKSHEKKALRGVPKYIQDKSFRYDSYLEVLEQEKRVYSTMTQIRSYKHNVSTVEICKSVLHGFDSKRYILEDGVHTLAWGHILITN